MIVLRKTMDAALAAERARTVAFYAQYGNALDRVLALQVQLSAWVRGEYEPNAVTPEQMAQMFYAQDSGWQARFFSVMETQVQAVHDGMPPRQPNEFRLGPGVPAGETQWCWMADSLDDSGFATIEAMYEHAKAVRDRRAQGERP